MKRTIDEKQVTKVQSQFGDMYKIETFRSETINNFSKRSILVDQMEELERTVKVVRVNYKQLGQYTGTNNLCNIGFRV